MSVRQFDGTDDNISHTIGGLSGWTFGTTAIMFNSAAPGAGSRWMAALHNSGGTFRAALLGTSGTDRLGMFTDTSSLTGVSFITGGIWYVCVIRKGTGTVAPRFSLYNMESPGWTHTNGSTAISDATAPGASGTVRTSVEGVEFFQGMLAVRAVWSNEVHWAADSTGDAQIEAAGLETSLQNWVDEAPTALWKFNQASTGTACDDLVGTAHQSALTGTTVVEGDDPPGFDFSLAVAGYAYTPARLPGRIGPDGRVFVTGVRYDDTATAGTSAPAGVATGTGSAPQPNIALGVSAGAANGTGIAPQPVAAVRPGAGSGAATGSALQPTTAIGANAGVASGTGSAPQPVAAVKVNAGVAEASGSALQTTVSTVPATSAPAGLASASGSAGAPTIAITVRPAAPTATGTAPQPTVSISGSANALAGLASATGSALAPTIAVRAFAGVASGTGAGNAATVLTGDIGFAALAGATGSALAPTIAIRVLAGVAAGVGTAPQPVGQGDLPVERISDPLTLTALGMDLPLTAVDAPLTLEALEDD